MRTTTSSNRKPGDQRDRRGRPCWITRQKYPRRTRILQIPSKPYSRIVPKERALRLHKKYFSRFLRQEKVLLSLAARKLEREQNNSSSARPYTVEAQTIPRKCLLRRLFLTRLLFYQICVIGNCSTRQRRPTESHRHYRGGVLRTCPWDPLSGGHCSPRAVLRSLCLPATLQW